MDSTVSFWTTVALLVYVLAMVLIYPFFINIYYLCKKRDSKLAESWIVNGLYYTILVYYCTGTLVLLNYLTSLLAEYFFLQTVFNIGVSLVMICSQVAQGATFIYTFYIVLYYFLDKEEIEFPTEKLLHFVLAVLFTVYVLFGFCIESRKFGENFDANFHSFYYFLILSLSCLSTLLYIPVVYDVRKMRFAKNARPFQTPSQMFLFWFLFFILVEKLLSCAALYFFSEMLTYEITLHTIVLLEALLFFLLIQVIYLCCNSYRLGKFLKSLKCGNIIKTFLLPCLEKDNQVVPATIPPSNHIDLHDMENS
ncbi:hypothetical protein CAEBREN_12680 [Caenorhabditis brenneri]|uniref:Uncharacterized protein n=1 Tax=Caenorhabditis brenneri TaxID=135651 RepID=G0N1D4_CAEBE|nr:hypothetical protein CAEBREN_12680 [Caenorhabditis brenneri]